MNRTPKRQREEEAFPSLCNTCSVFHENLHLHNSKKRRLFFPLNFDIATNLVDCNFFAVDLQYFKRTIAELLRLECTIESVRFQTFLTYKDDEGKVFDQANVLTLMGATLSKFSCSDCSNKIEFKEEPNQSFKKMFESKENRKVAEFSMTTAALPYLGKIASIDPPRFAEYYHCSAVPDMLSYLSPSRGAVIGRVDTISCFSSEQILRLAARCGVSLNDENVQVIDHIRGYFKHFVHKVVRCASLLSAHRTVPAEFITAEDILFCLKNQFDIIVYGCGGMDGIPPTIWTEAIQAKAAKFELAPKYFTIDALTVVNDLLTSIMLRLLESSKGLSTQLDQTAAGKKNLSCGFFDVAYDDIGVTFFEFADDPGED